MAGEMGDKIELKQSIVDTLVSSLSYDQNERVKAEDQIKILETAEGMLSSFVCEDVL